MLILMTDFDECAGEGSGNTCEEGCVNYPGGFNCTCSDGFQVISNTQCQGTTADIRALTYDQVQHLDRKYLDTIHHRGGGSILSYSHHHVPLHRIATSTGNRQCTYNAH